MEDPRIVVITGLSGAGRTTAANALEDIGYFCVDNMPPALLAPFAQLCAGEGATLRRVALVIDIREREFFDAAPDHLGAFTARDLRYEVLFLEAATEALVQRYSESRRRHPMADAADDLPSAILAEREKLAVLRRHAATVIDTTRLNVHQLREAIRDRYGEPDATPPMQVHVVSFGYKFGVPAEVDLLFDVRFLPNPHYEPTLRARTGLDPAVRAHVFGVPRTGEFLDRVMDLLAFVLPAYAEEGKSYLTIGIGCTGGRHRSVAVAMALAERLGAGESRHLHVRHRDLHRSEAP